MHFNVTFLLALAFGACVLVAGTGVGVAHFLIARESLRAHGDATLLASAVARKVLLGSYLDGVATDLDTLVRQYWVKAALTDLAEPALVEPDGSSGSETGEGLFATAMQERYRLLLGQFAELRGYADLILLDREGRRLFALGSGSGVRPAGRSRSEQTGPAYAWLQVWLQSPEGRRQAQRRVPRLLVQEVGAGGVDQADGASAPEAESTPSVVVIQAVRAQAGAVGGYLAAVLPLDRLRALFAAMPDAARTVTVLRIDGRDHVIGGPSGSGTTARLQVPVKAPDPARAGGATGQSGGNVQGQVVAAPTWSGPVAGDDGSLIANVPMPWAGQPLNLLVIQPLTEALRPISRLGLLSALAAAAILFFLVLSSSVLARRLSRPIRELTQQMLSLAGGDSAVTIPHRQRRDEIGAMARAVDRFRAYLHEGRELQRKVAEEHAVATRRAAVLQQIFDAMPGAIYMIDNEDRISIANRQMAEMFDLPEPLHRPGAPFLAVLKLLAERGLYGAGDAETLARRRLADFFHQRESEIVSTILNMPGQPVYQQRAYQVTRSPRTEHGVVTVSIDVTEYERLKRAYVASEAQLKAIFRATLDAIVTVDARGRIGLWNPAAERMFGYPASKAQGRCVHDLISLPGEEEAVAAGMAAFARSGEGPVLGQVREVLGRRADGTTAPFELAVAAFRLDEAWWAVGVLRDITDRKAQEAALQAAKDQAERATQAKSAFLATISHEIRTPMNGILSMASLLAESELSADQRGLIRIMRESAEALLSILNDILDEAKIEAGRLSLECVPFALHREVEAACTLLAPRADEKGLRLLLDSDPSLPAAVAGDPLRLRQILLNLLGNAIKFTEQGTVLVRLRAAAPDAGATETGLVETAADGATAAMARLWVCLDVSDTGAGLSASQQERLFQPFVQADSSTTRRYGGTGLGLSICRGLVDLMGGRLVLDSAPGRGTTVSCRLPFAVVDPVPQRPSVSFDRVSVLLAGVEDDVARLLAASLGQAGVAAVRQVATLADALAHLRALEGEPPDASVLILDAAALSESCLDMVDAIADAVPSDRPLPAIVPVGPRPVLAGLPQTVRGGAAAVLAYPLGHAAIWEALRIAAGLEPVSVGPAETGARPRFRPPTVAAARRAEALVLIVDDNATNRTVLEHVLDRLGYAWQSVADGSAALARLSQPGPGIGLVLTDLHMPDMDGFALTERIRSAEAATGQPRRPVIGLTADASPGTRQRCRAAGMDGYLTKPIDLSALAALLQESVPQGLSLRREEPLAGSTEPEASSATSGSDDDAGAGASELPCLFGLDRTGIDPEVLDLRSLVEVFGSLNDRSVVFLTTFVRDTESVIERIVAALASGQVDAAQEAAHSLEGAARCAGARALGRLAGAVQDALDAGRPDLAADQAERLGAGTAALRGTVDRLDQSLRAHRARLPGS